jgi:hypothetical protein
MLQVLGLVVIPSHTYLRIELLCSNLSKLEVRFQVLTAASMKMAVFWVVAPCSLVEVYRRYRGPCCLINYVLTILITCDKSYIAPSMQSQ